MSVKGEFNQLVRLAQKIKAIDEELEKNIMRIPDDERELIVSRQISRMKTVCEMLNQHYSTFDTKSDAYRLQKQALKREIFSKIQMEEQAKGTIWEDNY